MSTDNADDESSIDTEPQRLVYDAGDPLEADAIARTANASLELPDLPDCTTEVVLSPDGQIRLFLDAEPEPDGAGCLGTTLVFDAATATDLGYALIDAGRDAQDRNRDD